MKYRSTRGMGPEVDSAVAIIKGLAEDKGLFVPAEIPALPMVIEELEYMSYQEVAGKVIGAFFSDFTDEEIRSAVEKAYDEKFEDKEIAPITEAGGAFFLELYHGPTSAFKDMALSILPHLLTTAVKKTGEKSRICILTATSGDTGKAALQGFADVEGTEIIVFYPEDGVSPIQKLQMKTQEGENTHVFGIKGNFDDAQRGVKTIFADEALAERLMVKGVRLSSANSINIGRLVPQVAYYVYGYGRLIARGVIEPGRPINVAVPTGNFGNILAAYYAKKMGLPIKTLICASNKNRVLDDFIKTGVYDSKRDFFTTMSPSMDILVSSNLERLIYDLSGENSQEIKGLMDELAESGKYEVSRSIKAGLNSFLSGYADEDETLDAVKRMFRNHGYLMDTHTAVAFKVYEDYKRRACDETPTLIASTASPFKFASSIADAFGIISENSECQVVTENAGVGEAENLEEQENSISDFDILRALSKVSGAEIPKGLKELENKPIRHNETIEIDEMMEAVEGLL